MNSSGTFHPTFIDIHLIFVLRGSNGRALKVGRSKWISGTVVDVIFMLKFEVER